MKVAEQEKVELLPGMMLRDPSNDETYLLLKVEESDPRVGFGPKILLLELSTSRQFSRRKSFIMFWEII